MLTILLLAAGSSSRMRGADKLMQDLNGAPLIRLMAERALKTGCDLVISLAPHATSRRKALADLTFIDCPVEDADKGMAHSIRAGIATLPKETTAVMIVPADMPDLDSNDLMTMIESWHKAPPDSILRGASASGKPGHPVIFPNLDFRELLDLSGDHGARGVLKENSARVRLVSLPDCHALTDLDTPEDWETWRRART